MLDSSGRLSEKGEIKSTDPQAILHAEAAKRLLLSFERHGGIGRRAGLIILWLPGPPGSREGSNPFYNTASDILCMKTGDIALRFYIPVSISSVLVLTGA